MPHFDVFNGDADGICSLLQLRLQRPRAATLVTGAKRDIALLDRVDARSGDSVTVLDISLAANHAALERLLARGVTVEYFDHHYAGSVPRHTGLAVHLDADPDVCTGILVDRFLGGTQRVWATVAAFGDNLLAAAEALSKPLLVDAQQLAALHDLADCLTYNGYGEVATDAIVRPDTLYTQLLAAVDPFRFMAEGGAFAAINAARQRDLAAATAVEPARVLAGARIYVLPDAAWARRVRGILGNALANAEPRLAHALLTVVDAENYMVSVRAPRANPVGADALCRHFSTGGGRAAAAGIARLPRERIEAFIAAVAQHYPQAFPVT